MIKCRVTVYLCPCVVQTKLVLKGIISSAEHVLQQQRQLQPQQQQQQVEWIWIYLLIQMNQHIVSAIKLAMVKWLLATILMYVINQVLSIIF